MSPEDMQRFEIESVIGDAGQSVIDVYCPACRWHAEIDAPTLAELVQRAEEHTEVCR